MTPPRASIQCPDCKRKTRNWYQMGGRRVCHLCYEMLTDREIREELRKERGRKGSRRNAH